MDWLKQRLVAGPIGRMLLEFREQRELKSLCKRPFPESGTVLLQSRCARFLMPRLLTSGETFLDVGAHFGSVLSLVHSVSPQTPLIAVEAIPSKAELLRKNFPLAVIHACAVGDADGVASFVIQHNRSGYSSLDHGHSVEQNSEKIEVPIRRLDNLKSAETQVVVIKINVEGAEAAALRGSARLIDRCRPVVVFESAPGGVEGFGEQADAVHRWFEERNYEITLPDRVPHDAPGLSTELFLDSHQYPRRALDYFARPSDRNSGPSAGGCGSKCLNKKWFKSFSV
jgi:FkbM family methyltransferase